jgi:hypothetical protein
MNVREKLNSWVGLDVAIAMDALKKDKVLGHKAESVRLINHDLIEAKEKASENETDYESWRLNANLTIDGKIQMFWFG